MILKRLLKSKKGGVPVLSEIVHIVMSILPTPIKILLFVLLITTISSFFIPAILGEFGYACVNEANKLELYQTPMKNILGKTSLDLFTGLETTFFPSRFQFPDDPYPNGDKHYLRVSNQCFITSMLNGSQVVGYPAKCINCPTNGNLYQYLFSRDQLICIGDGDTPFYGSLNDELCIRCMPPKPFYYNHSNCINNNFGFCVFTIKNESYLGDVGSDFDKAVYLQKIKELGGVKRQQSSSEFINIQCTASAQPSLYFFSIEIFNRMLWVYLCIAYALVGFAFFWYHMTLK